MSLRTALARILTDYPTAKSGSFAGNPLAGFIRTDLKLVLEGLISALQPGLMVESSPGKGNWAEVPWAAVFDLSETDTAQRGFYVVYLFNPGAATVTLSLNQGTTSVRKEFGRDTGEVLEDRSRLARLRLKDWNTRFPFSRISLGSTQTLPKDYEAGHILGRTYAISSMPSDSEIARDLDDIIFAYRAMLFRGPPETVDESDTTPSGENATLIEKRQYARHFRIERNPKAARLAKAFHGTKCQTCGMDFSLRYGPMGAGYIEAHHLIPISDLKEGQALEYDIAKDFSVLCANCHRMIHRMDDPSDLKGLRKIIRAQRDLIRQQKG